jgi:hypothetical protein
MLAAVFAKILAVFAVQHLQPLVAQRRGVEPSRRFAMATLGL